MLSDLKITLRSLLKSPGYTATAISTLTLGIGVNIAMFSVVNAVLLQPGPYPKGDRLVRIFRTSPQSQTWPMSLPNFRDLRSGTTRAFRSVAAFQWWNYSLGRPGQPAAQLAGVTASADLFATLGVPPLLGRTFTAAEQQPGRDDVAVLSYNCWQNRFSGDPRIIGRVLRLDGRDVTVIGVMPPSFAYPMFWGDVDVWRPLELRHDWRADRGTNWLNAVARLRPGVSLAQAQAQVDTVAARLARSYPANDAGTGLRLVPFHVSAMDHLGRSVVWLTLGLAGVVLLIACANLANLQLARAIAGARSLAVRTALGASRRRLMGQMLTESVVLSVAGGVLGLVLASWITYALGRMVVIGDNTHMAFLLDRPVFWFALMVSLATGVVFGSLPAWVASRTDVNSALKRQTRGSTGNRSQHRLRQALIVGEVALALTLLSGAGFFLRGLHRFMLRDFGWDTSGLLTGRVTLPSSRYPDDAARRRFAEKLEARLATLPGVSHFAVGSAIPITSFGSSGGVIVAGRPRPIPGREPLVYFDVVSPDYFATLRITLVAGRLFPRDLRPDSQQVVIINQAMARKLWPGQNPIGQRISFSADHPQWEQVIGVVRDVAFAANFGTPDTRLQAYRPLVLQPWGHLTIVLRANAPATLAGPLRRLVAGLDPDLPVANLWTVHAAMSHYQHNFRVVDRLLSGFALLGLLLSALGLYSVISHLVIQRLPEFGIRIALGAPPRTVLWLVLGSGLRLVAVGCVVGLVGAFGLLHLLSAILPAVPGQDLVAPFLVVAGIATIAALACLLPARRATRVDPMIALRAE